MNTSTGTAFLTNFVEDAKKKQQYTNAMQDIVFLMKAMQDPPAGVPRHQLHEIIYQIAYAPLSFTR